MNADSKDFLKALKGNPEFALCRGHKWAYIANIAYRLMTSKFMPKGCTLVMIPLGPIPEKPHREVGLYLVAIEPEAAEAVNLEVVKSFIAGVKEAGEFLQEKEH